MAFFFPKRRFDPRHKPQVGGPQSEIQAAVKENCQRLGMPVPLIYCPMWDKSSNRVYNYGSVGSFYSDSTRMTYENSGAKYDGTSASATYSRMTPPKLLNTEITVGAIHTRHSGSFGSEWTTLLSDRDSDGQANIAYELRFGKNYTSTDHNIHFAYRVASSWHLWNNVGYSFSLERPYHLAFSFKYGTGSSILAVLDGNNETTGGVWSIGNGNSVPTVGGSYWYINCGFGWEYSNTIHTIHLAYLFDKALPFWQLQLLYEQPYALVQPVVRRVYFDLASAPPPSTVRPPLVWVF